MSDEKKDQAATQPIKKTSAVPLRKETVRVTLKAPGAKPGGAPAGVEPAKPAATPTMKLGNVVAPKPLMASPTIPLGAAMAPPAAKAAAPDVKSGVPLKQETMRVTLKADKGGKPSGPPPVTAAPPAPGAKAPSAPAPAPAPTIPLRSGPKPSTPAPAPTIPLGGGAKAPSAPAPAPTMKLGGAAPVGLATQPLSAPASGGASQPLPKATVELQQTQQLTQGLGAPVQAATIQTASEDEEAQRGGAGAALPLSIIAFVLSLVVLYFQFSHAKIWVDAHKDGDIMEIFSGSEE